MMGASQIEKEFLEKIANLLGNTRTSLRKLEALLQDEDIKKNYKQILESSELLFLPPFQMCMVYVYYGQGLSCQEVIEKVNVELEPLGITLRCA